jgi:hypothetical protein
MIDVAIAREAFRSKELSDVGYIPSECNPADALTKAKTSSALQKLVKANTLDLAEARWILRPQPP